MTPFRPRWVKDLAEEITEAPAWLVHGLLPKGILALLAAYPKIGKSTLATQVAVAVAQGRLFLGRPTQQGGVLYVVAEERQDDVMRRLRRFGMNDSDPIWLWTETATDTETDRGPMKKFVSEKNITLVIIDTWASYLMIQDETNNSVVTARMKPYVDMAHDSEATILFVHHERKNRDEGDDDARAIRGGGAILGLADLAFQLQKEPGGGTRRRLKIVGRYQEIPSLLKLDYGHDGYASLGTPEEHTRAAQQGKVFDVLQTEGDGYDVPTAATKAGLTEPVTRRALEALYAAGKVGRRGAGRKGDPYRYLRSSLAEEASGPANVTSEGSEAIHA